jgi:hypothetical protein
MQFRKDEAKAEIRKKAESDAISRVLRNGKAARP